VAGRSSARTGLTLVLSTVVLAATLSGQSSAPPRVSARDVAPAALLAGPHHKVEEAVVTDGFFHRFTLTSDYGQLEANGVSQLVIRVDEVRALAALDDVSKSEVFLQAAGGAVVNIGRSTAKVVTDPVDSAKNIGAGVKRFGVNLGRMGRRAASSAGNDTQAASTGPGGAEGAANSVLGVTSSVRTWARKVGADPYTTNPILQDALKGIAQVDAAGTIATRVVVPIPTAVTTTASVGDLVWGKDPEELRKINEQRLGELNVSPTDAARFFQNRGYTLSSQTRFIAALHAVKPAGAAAYVTGASHAEGERHALFFVESAEMLGQAHAASPVTAILDDSQALVARQGARAVVLLPLDEVPANAEVREVLADINRRARTELAASSVEARLTGRFSDAVRAELKALGWTVAERVERPRPQ
jgi:hypothetical protein